MAKQINISKKLKFFLSVNYLADTIITQSELEVNEAVVLVVKTTTRTAQRLHKKSAVDIILKNLADTLEEAKKEGRYVTDEVALYLLLCSLSAETIRVSYGMNSNFMLDLLKVDFTADDVYTMFYLFNKLDDLYGRYTLASDPKLNYKKYAPKKEKKPRDVSKKQKDTKKKDKTRNVLKAKARKEANEKRLNALRERLSKIKNLKENYDA